MECIINWFGNFFFNFITTTVFEEIEEAMDAEEDEMDVETEDPDASAESPEALSGSVFLLFGSDLPDLLAMLIFSLCKFCRLCLTAHYLRKVKF